eukprot:2187769-Rhodomonas_salina.2
MDSLDVIDGEVARVVVLAEDHLHEARLAALVLGPVMVLVITLAARARARPLALQQQHLVRQTIADKVVRLSQDLHRSGPGRTPTHGVGARPDVPPRDAALEGEAAGGAGRVEGTDGKEVRGRLELGDAEPAVHVELERTVELVPTCVQAVGVGVVVGRLRKQRAHSTVRRLCPSRSLAVGHEVDGDEIVELEGVALRVDHAVLEVGAVALEHQRHQALPRAHTHPASAPAILLLSRSVPRSPSLRLIPAGLLDRFGGPPVYPLTLDPGS